MSKILIIEDDSDLREGLAFALELEGYETAQARTLRDARALLEETPWDLLLLDCNLPDGSGFDLVAELHGVCATPVFMLTARNTEMDEVKALELGVADYMSKPFSLAVLRARVAVQLRTQRAQEEAVRIGPFHFDFARMVFSREGVPVELSKTEQRLLRVLVENRGHAVSRSDLIDRVWSEESAFVEENALSVSVKRLRAKLERDPAHPQWLCTVRGIGYEWRREP